MGSLRHWHAVWALCFLIVAGERLCGQFEAYTTPSDDYTFVNNAWADNGSGAQCLEINDPPTSFTVTWRWTSDSSSTKSFPHVSLNTKLLPIKISDLRELRGQAQWSLAPASSSQTGIDTSGLTDLAARCNVAVDLFADSDPLKASNTTQAAYEVMVWVGIVGEPEPLGWLKSSNYGTQQVGGVTYSLYVGENQRGQKVFSWLASDSIADFNEDFSLFVQYLAGNGFMNNSTFIGIIQFGSETWFATEDVKFSVQSFGLGINGANGDPTATGTDGTSATSTGKPNGASRVKVEKLSLLPHWLVTGFSIFYWIQMWTT